MDFEGRQILRTVRLGRAASSSKTHQIDYEHEEARPFPRPPPAPLPKGSVPVDALAISGKSGEPMADIPQHDTPGASFPASQSSGAQADAPGSKCTRFGPNARIWNLGLVLALVFLAAMFLRTIRTPWVEEDTWYGAVYSQAAHNNLRAGVLASGGVPATLYFGALPIPKDAFYVHHPTLLPLLVTGSFAIFGEAEWSARLIPIVCSLASVALLWMLVRSLLGRRAAAFGALFFVTLPMELHYGDMVDFEPCLVMCMLAALVCLRYWDITRRWKWGVGAAISCQLALWMDWPGYLFVISIATAFFAGWLWKRPLFPSLAPRQSLRWGLLLIGMVGLSGMLFLLQIHYVNAGAWEDLWNALRMRLGNHLVTNATGPTPDAPHFSWLDWFRAIFHGMSEDFLLPPFLFAALGIAGILRGRKTSEGLRWCGMAVVPMVIAGILYVVILRNESFVHDFATFYLIGALALLAAVGLELCLRWSEQRVPSLPSLPLFPAAVLAAFCALAAFGFRQAEAQRSQFLLLDGFTKEPRNLVPALGHHLAAFFPPGTSILCNFDPYGTTLNYYAQRTLITSLMESGDWKAVIAGETAPLGGIVWLDAPGASEIVASLPKEEVKLFTLGAFRFVLWKARG
jgi:4-amino-4-deoxy-L-arabinose transferase-like glycosyltransferase